jgi:prepilin-type N-terminal cleavage/methylation domain-containing protein
VSVRHAIARATAEAGFTMIELVITLSIIAVGIFGTMQVSMASLASTNSSNTRVRAVAIASREVESIRSAPYSTVGMASGSVTGSYSDSDGHTYSYAQPTGATTAASSSEVAVNTTYTITRAIVWVSVGTNTQAYKRAIVKVSWTDRAGTHTIRQDDEVYPGGQGTFGGSTTTSSTTSTTMLQAPGTPGGLSANQDSINTTTQIDLSWSNGSPGATTWEVQHSLTTDFASYTVDTTTQPGANATYNKTGLAPGTTFYFRVRALGNGLSSAWSSTASAATASPPSTVCTAGTANVTPSYQNRANSHDLSQSVYVSIHMSGTCSGLKVKFTPDTTVVTLSLASETGGVWDTSPQISATAYSWGTGIRTLTITDSAGTTTYATLSMTVCAKNASCP